ncbi:MAG: ABC transporter substrate binding protein [Pseudomonadota bacterium]
MQGLASRSILLALLFYFCSAAASSAADRTQQSILLLSSDMVSGPFYSSFKNGLDNKRADSILVHTENLDMSRLQSDSYRADYKKWLKEKYRNIQIDAIVVVGHAPLKFLLSQDKDLWPGVPILFTMANAFEIAKIPLPPNVSGKTVRANFADMVATAKSLLPDTRHIALIGNPPGDEIAGGYSAAQIARLSRQIEVTDLRGRALDEVKQAVSGLPKDSVIYAAMLAVDDTHKKMIDKGALIEISKIANAPLLTDDPDSVGLGPLAALSFDPATQGSETAELVKQVLGGASVSSLDMVSSGYIPVLDWQQVKHWHVDEKTLPFPNEMRFYTPGIWEKYRWRILASLALCAGLLALAGALLLVRKRRAAATAESRQVLVQIDRMNRKMSTSIHARTISRELAPPLAAIASNAEAAQTLLEKEPLALNLVQQALANLRRDNLHANTLLKNMQALPANSESELKPLDINLVVRRAVKFLAAEARKHRVQLKMELTPGALVVAANQVQLQQVLLNLLVNGIDAIGEKDGPERKLAIQTSVFGADQARISIADTGTGFGQDTARVFAPYVSTKAEGMGLGLWIAASIVQEHGGQVRAENRQGGGLIRIELPLCATAAA